MTPEVLLAMASFSLAAAMTPGPNNIMLTASGVNFGLARSLPHMLGVIVGFAVLLAAAGLGLGGVFIALPQAQWVLKIAGALYLLWLAWKVATAAGTGDGTASGARPMTFLQAAMFQWINPKALVTVFGAVAVFVHPGRIVADLTAMVAVFTLATVASVVTWTAFGAALSRVLKDPVKIRAFNVAMALLLVASIVPMVWT